MKISQLRHSDESCIACLAYLFERQTVLWDQAKTFLLKHAPNRSTADADDEEDVLRVLGTVVWEIFSDNHEVTDAEGKIFDLGSWRGSGGFIADFLNSRFAPENTSWFDYMDFYGGFRGGHDSSLFPLYVYFFQKLRDCKYVWRYSPPALYLIDLAPDKPEEDMQNYNPGSALLADLQKGDQEASKEEARKRIEEGNAEMRAEAVNTPPLIVLAYKEVHGEMPVYLEG